MNERLHSRRFDVKGTKPRCSFLPVFPPEPRLVDERVGWHDVRLTAGSASQFADEGGVIGARPSSARADRPRVVAAFSVIDMASGAVLAQDADARTTIDVLTGIDSIFDVLVEVWDPPPGAWRRLTPGEQRMLWDCRGR